MENWRILYKQSEPKGQTHILQKGRNSFVAVKKTGYKILTGLSQGTVEVLKDPVTQKGAASNTASSESVSDGRGRCNTHSFGRPERSSSCQRGNSS
jgi:hypothetical protein